MSIEMILAIAGGVVVAILLGLIVWRKLPKRLKAEFFMARWKDLQANLSDARSWPTAIVEADKLLDRALKKRKFRGKSMGERLVSAQRVFTDNDAVWFAHNLCKKILADDSTQFREIDVKEALMGFRQALRDIGALPSDKEQVTNDK